MIGNLTRNWWAFVLQGVLAIGVGIAAFAVPSATLSAFLAVFGAYAVVAGVFEIAGGFSMANGPKWSLVLGGLVSIAVGVITFVSPSSTAVAASLLVGIYAIAAGVGRTSAAYMLGQVGQTSSQWLLYLSGIVSILFGVLLIASPGDGVLAVLWLIGFYAIFAGVVSIAFGIRLRGLGQDVAGAEKEFRSFTNPGSDSTTSGSSSTGGTTAASH